MSPFVSRRAVSVALKMEREGKEDGRLAAAGFWVGGAHTI